MLGLLASDRLAPDINTGSAYGVSMQIFRHTNTCATLVIVAMCLPVSLVAGQDSSSQSEEESGIWAEVVRLYEKAKEAGGQVPKDVYEWVKQDLERIGDWEYRVVDIESADAGTLEERLNAMGLDRWECFFVQSVGSDVRLMMKRPRRAYLRHLPVSDMLKLLPTDSEGSNTP